MIETTILNHLTVNEDFTRKAFPHLKEEYFHNDEERIVFRTFAEYMQKYNQLPSKEALIIDLNNRTDLKQNVFDKAVSIVSDFKKDDSQLEWLLDQTEKFCQDKALTNALMASIQIIDDKTGQLAKGSIPKILTDALAVSFDNHIGHDFIEDWVDRYDFYNIKETKIQFDLELLNKITKGGLNKKTLNVIMAATGGGKSLFMTHCAAANLMDGKNVLYITLEMAEERIAERIDANLMNIPVSDLGVLPKETYQNRITRIREKTSGKIIIKEYPTAAAGANNFRYLLNELKLKKNFVPDIIYIDYINLCISSRMKYGANVNSYTYIKSIAEELRGLAIEFNVPIVTATQVNRTGYASSDIGLEDTAESFGLPATADIFLAIISSEELDNLNQIVIKQLKNRYNDPNAPRSFVIGIDRSRMKLYDVEQDAQGNIQQDKPIMDAGDFAPQWDIEAKFDKNKFKDFR